jgi:hypothetical protein
MVHFNNFVYHPIDHFITGVQQTYELAKVAHELSSFESEFEALSGPKIEALQSDPQTPELVELRQDVQKVTAGVKQVVTDFMKGTAGENIQRFFEIVTSTAAVTALTSELFAKRAPKTAASATEATPISNRTVTPNAAGASSSTSGASNAKNSATSTGEILGTSKLHKFEQYKLKKAFEADPTLFQNKYKPGPYCENVHKAKDWPSKKVVNVSNWSSPIKRKELSYLRKKFLGDNYIEVLSKKGTHKGVWRSTDGKRQFRVKDIDYKGEHGMGMPVKLDTPHIHLEFLEKKNSKEFIVVKNVHIPLIEK